MKARNLNEALNEALKDTIEVLFIDEGHFDKAIDDKSGWSQIVAYKISSDLLDNTYDENDNSSVSKLQDKILENEIKIFGKRKVIVFFDEYNDPQVVDSMRNKTSSINPKNNKIKILYPEF